MAEQKTENGQPDGDVFENLLRDALSGRDDYEEVADAARTVRAELAATQPGVRLAITPEVAGSLGIILPGMVSPSDEG